MSKEELLVDLNQIIKEVFEDECIEVTEESMLEDLEDWDSISATYLAVRIEEKYEIDLGEEMLQAESVSDIIDIILNEMKEKTK